MEPKNLDVRGLKCPEPLKRTQEELESIKEGVLVVLAESPANLSIERFSRKSGFRIESTKREGYHELKIIKTPHSKPKKEGILQRLMRFVKRNKQVEGLNDTMVVVSTNVFGRHEDIGRVLMKGFFETMKVMGDIPAVMFFMNSGVLLTTTDEEIIPLLKEFESEGVEIYSCSTCLKHFNLEESLKVGQAGGMAVLTDGMRTYKKIVTI